MNERVRPEPQATPEITAYLDTKREYERRISQYSGITIGYSDNSYYRFGYGEDTEEKWTAGLDKNIRLFHEDIQELGELLQLTHRLKDWIADGTADKAEEYQHEWNMYRYEKAEEARRPEREWSTERWGKIEARRKTIRGLNISVGLTWNKYYKANSEEERTKIHALIKSKRATIEHLEDEIKELKALKFEPELVTA
jgi:hypothetical protein